MIVRVTIKDVAKRAGFHHSTVSRALCGNPQIPEKTRIWVKELAREMGYIPDPAISALTAYRVTKRPVNYHSTIAWITNFPNPDGIKNYPVIEYYRGASQRATELGFKVEEFWLRQHRLKGRTPSQVLSARNIVGLLIAPQISAYKHISLDWDQFIAIRFGYTLERPHLHLVTNQHFQSFTTIVRKLRALGYRRIGMVLTRTIDARVQHLWSAAYLAEHSRVKQAAQIPIYYYALSDPEPLEGVEAWLKSYRPDAVIGGNIIVLRHLDSLGLRIPEDMGFALTCRQIDTADCAGIDENMRLTGAVAMDWMARLLQSGERGVPTVPQSLLMQGTWVQGKTVRRMN